MRRFTAFEKTVSMALVLFMLSFVLTSCASWKTGEMGTATKGALIGGALGALTGGILGDESKDIVKGAVIGAAVGYAAGWLIDKYVVRKTSSSAVINTAYKETAETKDLLIHNYQSVVVSDYLREGDAATWTTSFDVQKPGNLQKKVVETRQIMDPDGNIIKTNAYDYSSDINESNGYAFDLTLPIPEGAPDGVYTYSSSLTVGEGESKYQTRPSSFQITHHGSKYKAYAAK